MSERKNKPAIRFVGFTDDWEQRKLGEILQEQVNRTSNFESNPLFSLTIEKGVTPKTDRYERGFLVQKEEELFKIVRPDEFVTNPMNLRFGALGYNNNPYNISVSGYYDVFSIDENRCSSFWSAYFKTPVAIRKFDNAATGSLIEKRRVKYSTLTGLDFAMPTSVEEKIKIGQYFANLDNLITLHQRKYDKLVSIKKSMLEKMFPKKDSSVPEIRFSGFTDDWEQRKFSELYEKVSRKNDLSYGKDSIISVANMYYKTDSYITDADYLLTYNIFELGDIAFEGNKSKDFAHGRFVENTIGNGIVSHVFDVFKPIMPKYDLLFWKYAINNERLMGDILIRSTKASTMMTNLVPDDFLDESFYIPQYEEQRQIGAFLESLDNLITLHQRELEKLKNIKKSMLEKMFV